MQRGDPNRNTQCGQFLGLLIKARGGRVSLPAILALGIAQYNARVHELRRIGIPHRERARAGQRTAPHMVPLNLGPSAIEQSGISTAEIRNGERARYRQHFPNTFPVEPRDRTYLL